MNFENKLLSGVLIKRYKRFFVDIKIKNKKITAHCPNTGSMQGLLKKGNKVWLTKSNNPNRKLKYTLQIIEVEGSKVGVNTHITNKIFFNALQKNIIKEFGKNIEIKREVKFGSNTRFDFLVTSKTEKAFVEVKNVTLFRDHKTAEFPDAITSRGSKHLLALIDAIKKGYKSYLLFLVQIQNMENFKIAKDIDVEYYKNYLIAKKAGVNFLAYRCDISSKKIFIDKKLKIIDE